MGKWLLITALLALLALAIWVAYRGWMLVDVEMPGWAWATMALGFGFSIVIGVGLMSLVFYSSRMGYDEPPQKIERRDDDRGS
jgi:hypothetical protein